MKESNELPQKDPAYIFTGILALEEVITAINKFYDSIPKILCFRRPSIDKLIEKSLTRITYAIMNPGNVKREGNILPIESDSAGYFFPTAELQDMRTNLSSENPSGTDKDSVARDLLRMVTRGLNAFLEYPAYRYLAMLPPVTESEETVKNRIQKIAEEFPVSVKQSQPLEMRAQQEKERDVIENIRIYEETILPQMLATALVLHGLYFDLANFFLGAFMNEYIEKTIYGELRKMFRGESAVGLFSVLRRPYAYKILKKEKMDYLASKRSHAENRLYVPLALWAERQRIVLDSNMIGEGFTQLSNLKTIEFLDYNTSENYRGYVQCVKRKRDLRSVLHLAIQEISKKTNSTEAVARYLEIFQSPENRKKPFIKIFTGGEFIHLWSYAYLAGWGNDLSLNVPNLIDIVDSKKTVGILVRQNSGKFVSMLSHSGFRNHLKKIDAEKGDFESLYEIFCRDEALFNQVYPYISTPDREFVQSLAKLISSGDYNTYGIEITDNIKKFVASLGNYAPANAEAIIHVLQHFQIAQRTLSLGYTPFSGNLEGMEDKVAFSAWFFKNKEMVSRRVALADAVSPYLGDSTDPQLREALVRLLQKHGDEFCSKHLGELRCVGENQYLQEQAYLRIAGVLVSLIHAPRLCRRREIVKVLQYMASTASDSKWEAFSAKFAQINGSALSDYGELFEEYHAPAILKSIGSKGGMQEAKVLVETYTSIRGVEQKSLIDRLVEVLSRIEVALSVVKSICSRVIKEHFEIANFGITQLEKEESPEETLRIMNIYQNDDEFRNTPPDELLQ